MRIAVVIMILAVFAVPGLRDIVRQVPDAPPVTAARYVPLVYAQR